MQTLTLIKDDQQLTLPVFRCGECGDLFAYAALTQVKDRSFDTLEMVGQVAQQKARFCPGCGSKNKAWA